MSQVGVRICTSIAVLACAATVGCAGPARLPVEAGMGPNPQLPPPEHALIPVLNVARAVGWSAGETPTPTADTRVVAFATKLEHPRSLLVLPNGDVLVAETNAPNRPEDMPKGIRGWYMRRAFKKAGAAVPSANRITILRDADCDGVAETRSILLHDLASPFGMALVGDTLYVANADAILKFPYRRGQLSITAPGTKVLDLPGRPFNHHWTKSLIVSPDGKKLYASIGSNSNVGDRGPVAEEGRAAIWEIDLATGAHRIFASGLRNAVGLAWEPMTGALWASVNERDELGSDLVPDYMTAVRDGAFYGWPYSYYGAHVDSRPKPQRPDLVAKARVPDYALGPHTSSLGLASSSGTTLPERFRNGMFVGQHGSWNRRPFSGYQVLFVPFAAGAPSGMPVPVLTGFLDAKGQARGRPVSVAIDKAGGLLVADDVGNTIWRVMAK